MYEEIEDLVEEWGKLERRVAYRDVRAYRSGDPDDIERARVVIVESDALKDTLLRAVTRLREENERLAEALRRITERKGAFSLDRLTHAENTIEDMSGIALAALTPKGGDHE